MKARLFNTSKFRLVCACILSVCLAFVFSSNTFASETIFDYSNVWIVYYNAKYNTSSGTYDVIGSQLSSLGLRSEIDANTGLYSYSFTVQQNSNYNCNDKCYILIKDIIITPRTYTNPMKYPDSQVADYTHVWLYSVHDFLSGPMDNVISNMNNFYASPRGRDVWFPASSNHQSCEDSGQSECNVIFWNNNVDLDPVFAYNGFNIDIDNNLFDNKHNLLQTYGYFDVRQAIYNLNTHNFQQNDSFLYLIEPTNPIVFYGRIWQDDNATSGIDLGTDLGETSPDFDTELQNINSHSESAIGSADNLDVGFSVPWIFQSWFALFVNSDCTSITNLKSMIQSSESTVCTPWPSAIRSTLTPIFAILSSMLAFGFVIRWLSGHSKEGSLG